MISRIRPDIETRIQTLLLQFMTPKDVEDLKQKIFIFDNPVKRYFVFINQDTAKNIEMMGDIFFKGGFKAGTYNKNGFPRLNTNGFQYLGNSICKNFLDIDFPLSEFILDGVPRNRVILPMYDHQIAVRMNGITIGWAAAEGLTVRHRFPKSLLRLYFPD